MYSIPIFSYKIKDSLQYPRKVYFIDNGFITSISTRHSKDLGRFYENSVAIEILRRNAQKDTEIYYWSDRKGKEVDFVIKEGLQINKLIQVCYDIGDFDTKKREIEALLKASKDLKCNNLIVITNNYDAVEEIKKQKIQFISLHNWLLSS